MRVRNILGLGKGFALIASAYLMWGCGNANDKAPALDASGKHPADWYVAHRGAYIANPGQCPECHGADLQGGIAKVSCFSATFNGLACHFTAGAFHPAGWAEPTAHGAAAKQAPSQVTVSGFSSCRACHGHDFNGGVLSNNISCFLCHTTAPHSPAPWRASAGSIFTHTDTNASNAQVCAGCHLNNQRRSTPAPIPAGVTPGCFNNTLCHDGF